MIKINKILVPVDFSEGSELAVRYAATFACEYSAQVHMLNIVEEEGFQPGTLNDSLDTTSKWIEENQKQLSTFGTSKLKDLDVIRKVTGGMVYEQIISYAKENEIDLIIISSHGRTGFIESWLGGTTYEISRKAPCAVLTVKPEARGLIKIK